MSEKYHINHKNIFIFYKTYEKILTTMRVSPVKIEFRTQRSTKN